VKHKISSVICGLFLACVGSIANATLIEFTGGTIARADGGSAPCDWCRINTYVEDGYLFEFIGVPADFATSIGDYFGNGEDLFHGHFGSANLTKVRLTRVDNAAFINPAIKIRPQAAA